MDKTVKKSPRKRSFLVVTQNANTLVVHYRGTDKARAKDTAEKFVRSDKNGDTQFIEVLTLARSVKVSAADLEARLPKGVI